MSNETPTAEETMAETVGVPDVTNTLASLRTTREAIDRIIAAIERTHAVLSKSPLRCGFCCKTQREVKTFVAGAHAIICDECIPLAVQVLAEDARGRPQHEALIPAADIHTRDTEPPKDEP